MAIGHLLTIDHIEEYQSQHALSLYSPAELNRLRESYQRKLGFHYLRENRSGRAWHQLRKAFSLSPNRRQVRLLLMLLIRPIGRWTIGRVGPANNRVRHWARSIDENLCWSGE
jgi:hypothetical protein